MEATSKLGPIKWVPYGLEENLLVSANHSCPKTRDLGIMFPTCRELGTCCWSSYAPEALVVQTGVLAHVAVKKVRKAFLLKVVVGVM